MRCFKLDEFVAHSGTVNCLRIGRNTAGVLATGGEDKKVNLWRIGQPQVVKSLSGLQSPVECVTFDSGENSIAAGGANGTVKVWDLESGKVSRSLTGHRSNCLTLEFHPNATGNFITTGSLDTNVKVWDLRRKDAITTFKGHSCGVVKLAISPDGRWVCSGSERGEVKVWDVQSGRVVKDGWAHDNSITGIEFHPCEFLMATSSTDRTVKLWDLEVWEQIDTLGPEATAVRSIAFHKSGKQLLTATAEALKVWGCEPAVHHDTVPTDWRNLADMHVSYKDEHPRVVGCCRSNSAVGVFLVDLRKVAPFCQTGMMGEQMIATAAAGGHQMQQSTSCSQHVQLQTQRPQPVNGIGRHSLQQQQPAASSYSSGVQAYTSSANSHHSSYNLDGEAATAPAAGPLTRQLSRQRTPPGLAPGSYPTDKHSSIAKVKLSGSTGAEPLLQSRQPGQLQALEGLADPARPKTGDYFPQFEILVPAGPPPRPAEGHSRSSSIGRDRAGGPSNGSITSSRHPSGLNPEAATAAVQDLGLDDGISPARSCSSLQQPQQQAQQSQQHGVCGSSRSSLSDGFQATREVPAEGTMAAARPLNREWASFTAAAAPLPPAAGNKAYSAPGDSAPVDSTIKAAATAADPIVAAIAQRPLLKADMQRMVSALGLAKGFIARGNFEGAYKAVLNQGDAAVACMVVEALQGRQDAFELNSVEPLLKLLELLLGSGHEQQQSVGLAALSLLLRGPGQVVREVCAGPPPVGVDLSYEQRKNKCLLVKMGLEGLGMKVGVLARGTGSLAARAQLVGEELKRVVSC